MPSDKSVAKKSKRHFAVLFLIALLCVAVFIEGLVILSYNLHTNSPKPVQTSAVKPVKDNPPTRAELLKLVNAERKKHGVAPLKESPLLDKSAQWKADDEVKYNYFGHVKPGTTGNDGLDYLNSLKPPCSYIAENLVDNVATTQDVYKKLETTSGTINTSTSDKPYLNTAKGTVNAWIKSPAHHKAMINPRYSLTGFGINGTEVVEHFCQP